MLLSVTQNAAFFTAFNARGEFSTYAVLLGGTMLQLGKTSISVDAVFGVLLWQLACFAMYGQC
jgi:hypothetical protein